MVSENLIQIRTRIAQACERSGRDPGAVRIAAVVKNRAVGLIRESIACGITDIAENRVQEAYSHQAELADVLRGAHAVRLHMIGHLQTNKVKDAVRIFDLIHSVDSLRLAHDIETAAARIGKVQDILLEVNTSAEETKFGVRAEEVRGLAASVRALPHVRLRGLMTMAAVVEEPEDARPCFSLLRKALADVNAASAQDEPLTVLSMGMSQDYAVAVEEGATVVRIGRAIFDG